MAWLAVDKDGTEMCFLGKCPVRYKNEWILDEDDAEDAYVLIKGSIKKFIGRNLTWNDNPLKFILKEQLENK